MKFRVGQSIGRTIYIQTGEQPTKSDLLVGVLDTRALAAFAVAAMNNVATGLNYDAAAYSLGVMRGREQAAADIEAEAAAQQADPDPAMEPETLRYAAGIARHGFKLADGQEVVQ